jgi:hypothetical protein
MQQALQAMQQAQQQMQQLIQKLKQSQIAQGGSGSASRAEEGPGQLEEGERNSKRPSTWQVGLEPQEREVLSQVKAEAFPSRYEQALVQYYRALAGEADK